MGDVTTEPTPLLALSDNSTSRGAVANTADSNARLSDDLKVAYRKPSPVHPPYKLRKPQQADNYTITGVIGNY